MKLTVGTWVRCVYPVPLFVNDEALLDDVITPERLNRHLDGRISFTGEKGEIVGEYAYSHEEEGREDHYNYFVRFDCGSKVSFDIAFLEELHALEQLARATE